MDWIVAFLWSPALLVSIVAAICVWARRAAPAPEDDPWRTRIDLPVTLACGLLFALAAAWVVAPSYILGGAYTDVDLAVYCTGLAALRDGNVADWPGKLSLLPGFLLLWPARWFGVLTSLTGGAVIAGAFFGAALYVWTHAAAGRVAGVSAVLLALANHHLVILTRNPSFYPVTTAGCVVGVAGVAVALRWRSPFALFVGGCGVGLIMLADNRFLTMGVWSAALLLVATLIGPLRGLPVRIALAALPVAASWHIAAAEYDAIGQGKTFVTGTVLQAAAFLRDVPGYPPEAAPYEALREWEHAWGHDSIRKIPRAVYLVAEMASHVPPERAQSPDVQRNRAAFVDPWYLPLGVAVLAGLVGFRRKPWSLLAGFGLVAPFVANLAFVANTLPQPRVFALGMIAVPLLLAIGIGGAAAQRWRGRPAVALLAFLGTATIGTVPGFLSPWAVWRQPECAAGRIAALVNAALIPARAREFLGDLLEDPMLPMCLAAVSDDFAHGRSSLPFADRRTITVCNRDAPAGWWAPIRQHRPLPAHHIPDARP